MDCKLGLARKLSLTLRMISTLAYYPLHSPHCNDRAAGSFAYTTQICTMTSKGGLLQQTLSEIVVTLASPIEIKMHFLDVAVNIFSLPGMCETSGCPNMPTAFFMTIETQIFAGGFCGHLWSFAVKPCVDHTFDIIQDNTFLKTTLFETIFMVESRTESNMHFLGVLTHKLPSKTFDTFAYLEPNIADIVLHYDRNVCMILIYNGKK